MVSVRIEGLTQKKPDLWNCKCFFCGDSAKKKSKKRGFFYKKSNGLFYKCFNCDASTTFYKTLEFLDSSLAKEYSLERFSSGSSKHGNYTKPQLQTKPPVFKKHLDINLPSISSLGEDNIAKQYVLSRKIPKGSHKNLFYAEDFKKFVSEIKPDYEKSLIDNDPRLIIPFRDENGKLFAFQGRALSNNSLRYITIKLDEEKAKLFGLDTVNKKEPIKVCEGPIDSLFIKNCIATADSNLTVAEILGKDNITLVFDNEPRNKAIVKQIESAINFGFKVCLFPSNFIGKDINEAILNGLTKPKIESIIEENTFQGLRAKLEFNKWKKV